MPLPRALVIALSLALAACKDPLPPPATTPAIAVDGEVVTLEENFGGGLDAWQPVSGKWAIRSAGDERVLAQTATDQRFPVALWKARQLSDVDVTARFKPISGRVDASGGIVFRARDGNNYYVVRANSLEDNFRLYTVIEGTRSQIAGVTVEEPALGAWHTLRVVAVGDHIQAYLDDRLLIDHHDATFSSGWVGLWTKADAVTEFDDVVVRGTPQGGAEPSSAADPGTPAVAYTSVDQVFSEPVFRDCERRGVPVRGLFDTEETKSTGVLNRLIAEAARPQADVFWSGDPVRPFVLIGRGLVEPYRSPVAEQLPPVFRAADGTWTGFAARARVLLVNTEQVPEDRTPRSIEALADPKWKGKAAIANPLFGTTTMHVAALFTAWGEPKAKAFLERLKDNDVRIAASNGEVKRLVASGELAFGLTDTDDAHEAIGDGAPVRVVYPDQDGDGMGTLVMPTVAVLIKGGPSPQAGKRLIDCLLSAEVEARLARDAAHMPLRAGVEVPDDVRAASTLRPMQVDYAEVAKVMEKIQPWLRDWVGL